jgi:hypothetical protein
MSIEAMKRWLECAERCESLDGKYSWADVIFTIKESIEQAQKQEPLDTPLPCDVKVGHVTMRKGVALRTLVARMQVLYDMAQGQAQKQEHVAWLDEYGNAFPLAAKQYSVVGKHWMPLYTSPPQRQPLTDEIPKGVLLAISNAGLMLLKTQHGYELRKLGPAIAHGITGEKE